MGDARPRRSRTRRRTAAAACAESHDDKPARRMATEERRAVQRSDDARRTLGSHRVSERRRVADGLAVRERSEVPHRRVHDEHAFQARAGRLEVETRTMPRSVKSEVRSKKLELALALLALAAAPLVAQGPGGQGGPASTELTGSWAMVNDE